MVKLSVWIVVRVMWLGVMLVVDGVMEGCKRGGGGVILSCVSSHMSLWVEW